MNINSEYNSNEEKSFAEMAEIAMDSVEANIISKALDNLEIIDIIGFASVRVFVEDIAKKADAYEQLSNSENKIYRN